MSTPEDQIDTGAAPQGALSAVFQPQATSPEARQWGLKYLNEHPQGVDTSGEAELLHDFEVSPEEAKQALRTAREKLAAQRMNPQILGLRFAQAMLSPSRYGIPDQWSKAAGAVADWHQQQQDFEQKQAEADVPLAEQMTNLDQGTLKARLALQELKERTQGQMLSTALRATAKPEGATIAESPIGKLVEDRLGKGALQTDEGKALFDKLSAQKAAGVAGPPDPSAIDFGAYKLYKTGQMPSLGMGAGPARNAILAGAAHLSQREAAGEDISNSGYDQAIANGQDFTAAGRALGSFAGGPLGNQARALNNSVGHLKLFEDTFAALSNHDTQALNRLDNFWSKQFGQPAPTTLQAMGGIIGPELTKILTNTNAGTGEERGQFLAQAGSLANSPDQIHDALGALRGMLGRQAADLALQYHGATQRSDFAKRYLAPDVAESLQLNPETATQDTAKTGAQLPAAAKAQLRDGVITTFANKQKWTLRNGQAVQVP